MGIFKKFGKAYKVVGSETYRETLDSVEKIAVGSYQLLADKTPDEQTQILERVTELLSKLHDATDHETPLVYSLTLLTAIRSHHLAMQQKADEGNQRG